MLQIVGALILLIAGFAILRLLFRALISTASALAGLILLCLFGPALLAGYPGAGPSDSRWQPGFLLCRTWSALTRHNHITLVFTFIFCLQRYHTMKIITRGEAMRIHQQHPASRLFPFCTGKYRWHGSAEAYTGREVQDIPGVLAVFAERRKDSFGPYVRLMSVTLN